MQRFKPRRMPAPQLREAWPSYTLPERSTPFAERPPLRELRVVVDDDAVPSDEESRGSDEAGLLAGLLSHPHIRSLRYRDDGPPEWTRTEHSDHLGEVIPGWLIVGEPLEGGLDHIPVTWADRGGSGRSMGSISGNGKDVAESDERTPAYEQLDPTDAAARRRADAIAVQAADTAGADLFVTRRPYLHAVEWSLSGDVLVAGPEEALPLVGLYLRSQDEFIVGSSIDGRLTTKMNKGLFFWAAARELLPSGWRWFAACVQYPDDDDSFAYLGQSVFTRVQRALEARDAVHRALNKPQDNDTAEDALANLDFVLLSLMAAMDVTARVAHHALGLPDRALFNAGWQRHGWVREVAAKDPRLADLVAGGSRGFHTITMLSVLRNSIHGSALDPLAVGVGRRRRDATLVGLPHGDAERLRPAMEALGGRERFGVRTLLKERVHADPGQLLDATFEAAIELLNDLMRCTPVERIKGVSVSPDDSKPPSGDPIFSETSRRSIRWQLGIPQTT